MKKLAILIVAGLGLSVFSVHAQVDPLTKEDVASLDTADRADWKTAIEKVYKTKEEDIRLMRERGLSWPQAAIVAELAKASKKPIAEVMALRDGQQMGWAQMAKELKVNDKAVAKAVAKVRKDVEFNKYMPPKKPRKKRPNRIEQGKNESSKEVPQNVDANKSKDKELKAQDKESKEQKE